VAKRSPHRKKSPPRASRRNRRVKPGWIVLSIMVGLVAAYSAVTAGKPRLKQMVRSLLTTDVRSVVVKGTEQVNGDKMVSTAGIMAGVKIDRAKLDSLKSAFLRNPWVDKVNISRWAGRVVVSVVERKPIVLVSVGKVFQMDRGGVLLPLPAGDYLHAPLVCGLPDTTGAEGVHRIRTAGLDAFLDFWDALSRQDPPWRGSLAQIDFTAPHAIRLTLEAHSTVIEIGRDNVETKISQVSQMLDRLHRENGPQPRVVNLRYENLAFVE
jgi:cell division septal protein FtsQ